MGRADRCPITRCAERRRLDRVPPGSRPASAARGLHLQRRGQRQFPPDRDDRARVPQGLGDGVLCRLPGRPGGGPPHATARARMHLLHRRNREPARRRRIRGLRQREVRPAGARSERRSGARTEEHPRRAPHHRCRGGHRLGSRADPGERGGRRPRRARSRPADAARRGGGRVLAALPAAREKW